VAEAADCGSQRRQRESGGERSEDEHQEEVRLSPEEVEEISLSHPLQGAGRVTRQQVSGEICQERASASRSSCWISATVKKPR